MDATRGTVTQRRRPWTAGAALTDDHRSGHPFRRCPRRSVARPVASVLYSGLEAIIRVIGRLLEQARQSGTSGTLFRHPRSRDIGTATSDAGLDAFRVGQQIVPRGAAFRSDCPQSERWRSIGGRMFSDAMGVSGDSAGRLCSLPGCWWVAEVLCQGGEDREPNDVEVVFGARIRIWFVDVKPDDRQSIARAQPMDEITTHPTSRQCGSPESRPGRPRPAINIASDNAQMESQGRCQGGPPVRARGQRIDHGPETLGPPDECQDICLENANSPLRPTIWTLSRSFA